MPSSQAYLDHVLEQLSDLEGISFRAMMGEYLLYWQGQLFGGVYDDRLLVKSTPAARALLPEAEAVPPYPGAKPLLQIPDPEDRALLYALIPALCAQLPPPKAQRPRPE